MTNERNTPANRRKEGRKRSDYSIMVYEAMKSARSKLSKAREQAYRGKENAMRNRIIG
jgi:hypothetical protein